MTASRSRQSAQCARQLSTGHGTAHSIVRPSLQIVRQLALFDAARRSFVCRFTVPQPVASARSKSASSPAALKSP